MRALRWQVFAPSLVGRAASLRGDCRTGASRRARRRWIVAVALGTVGSADPGHAADLTATWLAPGCATSFWSVPASWDTNPLVPNNGNSGFTYDVVIDQGGCFPTVVVDQDVTVERLTIENQLLRTQASQLTTNDLLTVTNAGTFEGPGTTLARGGLTFNRRLSVGPAHRFVNDSAATWTPSTSGQASLTLQSAIFENAPGATLTATIPQSSVPRTIQALSLVTQPTSHFVNDGTFTKDGTGRLDIQAGFGASLVFENRGVLEVEEGTLGINFSSGSRQVDFVQTDGVLRVDGGALSAREFPGPGLDIQGGRFEGRGSFDITADVDAVLAPGVSGPGEMELSSSSEITLGENAILEMEIGGITQGSEYDAITGGFSFVVDGILSVSVLDGTDLDLIRDNAIILAEFDTPIQGVFDNVAPGGILLDESGQVSFRVLYGPTSRAPNFLLLVPEPGTALLVATGGLALLVREHRRHSRRRFAALRLAPFLG